MQINAQGDGNESAVNPMEMILRYYKIILSTHGNVSFDFYYGKTHNAAANMQQSEMGCKGESLVMDDMLILPL